MEYLVRIGKNTTGRWRRVTADKEPDAVAQALDSRRKGAFLRLLNRNEGSLTVWAGSSKTAYPNGKPKIVTEYSVVASP